MNIPQMLQYRTQALQGIAIAVTPGIRHSPEFTEACLQACIHMSASLFSARHALGTEIIESGELAAVIMDRMEEWRKDRIERGN